MAIQQQMSHHAPGKEAANAAAIAGHGALELRWMADDAGYNHARPVRRFRRRPAHRPARGRTRDRLYVLLAAGTALGGWELHGKSRVSGESCHSERSKLVVEGSLLFPNSLTGVADKTILAARARSISCQGSFDSAQGDTRT